MMEYKNIKLKSVSRAAGKHCDTVKGVLLTVAARGRPPQKRPLVLGSEVLCPVESLRVLFAAPGVWISIHL